MTKVSDEFVWEAHPLRERPRRAIVATLLVLGLSAAAGFAMPLTEGGSDGAAQTHTSVFNLTWAIIAFLFLFVSLNRFFFKTTFTLTTQGILAQYPLRKQSFSWTNVRRFVYDANGGYLSLRERASWLDAYSGMHLQFGQHRDDIIARIHNSLRLPAGSAVETEPPGPIGSEEHMAVGDGGSSCRG